MTEDQHPDLEWRGDVPVARHFDDPYFSLEDGLAETRHVFLAGNDLPERFRDGFHTAELGFGTGLNCIAALASWRVAGIAGALQYTAFERYPMQLGHMRRALAAYPNMAVLADPVLEYLEQDGTYDGDVMGARLRLRVIVGDVRDTLPDWDSRADAWFLDGFAPAKNPEMWEPEVMSEVARHTAPGGTVATYTAAGAVRRALAEAGFDVERRQGFGRKRHMTVGRLTQ